MQPIIPGRRGVWLRTQSFFLSLLSRTLTHDVCKKTHVFFLEYKYLDYPVRGAFQYAKWGHER